MKGTLLGVVIMAALVYGLILLGVLGDPFWALCSVIGLVAVLWPVVKVGERVNRWSDRRQRR